MAALIVGTLLALAALVYVLWPVIAAAEKARAPSPRAATPAEGEAFPARASESARISAGEAEDAAEVEIRRARAQLRVCPVCGPRPEPAARYCSRCGRALA